MANVFIRNNVAKINATLLQIILIGTKPSVYFALFKEKTGSYEIGSAQ
jgi:hypothetical protein